MPVSIVKLLQDISLPKLKLFIAAHGVLSLFLGIPLFCYAYEGAISGQHNDHRKLAGRTREGLFTLERFLWLITIINHNYNFSHSHLSCLNLCG